MKNRVKWIAVIALVAIVGFSMAACDNVGNGGGDDGNYDLPQSPPTPGLLYTLITGPLYSVSIGTADAVHIVIAPTHNGLPVTTIAAEGFRNSSILSVTIPDSIISIGSNAFSGCIGLTGLTIPNSVTSIGNSAFSGCTGLSSITIPNSVTSIGNSAFSGCTGLSSITIPNSVTSIGSSAFSGCTGLRSITIPNSVTSIGVYAFQRCTGLRSITIPDSVTSIGGYAFQGCTGLSSITIPGSVTSIGGYAFQDWTAGQTIHIPFAFLGMADGWSSWSRAWRDGSNAVIRNNAGVQVWPEV